MKSFKLGCGQKEKVLETISLVIFFRLHYIPPKHFGNLRNCSKFHRVSPKFVFFAFFLFLERNDFNKFLRLFPGKSSHYQLSLNTLQSPPYPAKRSTPETISPPSILLNQIIGSSLVRVIITRKSQILVISIIFRPTFARNIDFYPIKIVIFIKTCFITYFFITHLS